MGRGLSLLKYLRGKMGNHAFGVGHALEPVRDWEGMVMLFIDRYLVYLIKK